MGPSRDVWSVASLLDLGELAWRRHASRPSSRCADREDDDPRTRTRDHRPLDRWSSRRVGRAGRTKQSHTCCRTSAVASREGLEEAHSLVPEWNAATGDAEKWAVNGTARAVLQGRKYGFGCLLVTQRTASVTKSILNQCNTIFALRAYDATGAGFLENYIGAAYAPILAALKNRQAVVYGRASSCQAPIAVRLNDAATFDTAVWQPRVGTVPRCATEEIHPETDELEVEVEEGGAPPFPSDEDDIPF